MADAKENILTEEEKQDNVKFQELSKKPEAELTEDDKKELGELKERHSKRVQKRIDKYSSDAKMAREEAEEAKRETEELKRKVEALEKKPDKIELTEDDFTIINGKKFYTDDALIKLISDGKLSEDKARKHQKMRDDEETFVRVKEELNQEENKKKEDVVRKEDADKVLAEYPNFSKKHPDFNPEDPLYKLSTQLWQEGYYSNPKGLSLSLERAKQILGLNKMSPDNTGDLEIEGNTPPERKKGGEKEVTLSEGEKEAAVQMYCRGDVTNPKTGRAYSVDEALAKALTAKKNRQVK